MVWCGSYRTVKFVEIKDTRLGVLRLVLLLAIVGYVVIIEMAQLGGYLESAPVEGVVGFSLQHPTHDNCDPSVEGCTNAFQTLNDFDYCEQTTNATGNRTGDYAGSVYPCQIYEAVDAAIVRETSLIVLTRAVIQNETLVCDGSIESGSTTCPTTYKNQEQRHPRRPFYIAQTEAFTVLLEHAVTSRICDLHDYQNDQHYACSAQASRYQGRLHSTHAGLCGEEFLKNNSFGELRGSTLQSSAPCFIGANRTAKGLDFFSLHVLLQAVGVSLDDCTHDHDTDSTDCTTYRESGATLLLNIVWNDFRPFQGLVEPFYYYSPRLIGTHYKESLPFYHSYRTSRTLMRAHGIKIAVLVSGNFHQFRMLSFLITFTTAIGLLAIARKVVDILMLHVLPEKGEYHQVKFETLRVEPKMEPSQPSSLSSFVRRITSGGVTNEDDMRQRRDAEPLNNNDNGPLVSKYGSSHERSME